MKIDKIHSAKLEKVYRLLSSSPEGISSQEAVNRLSKFGQNILKTQPPESPLSLFISQFKNPIISLLLIVGAIAIGIQHYEDSIGIFVAVLLAALSGFIQEYKAERSLEALKKMEKSTVRVLRDKKMSVLPSSQLVPGDVIILSEGDKVPADARLIESVNLSCDEAIISGESKPVEKQAMREHPSTPLLNSKNIIFRGTSINRGRCRAIVFATGMNTEFGKIAQTISETEKEETPLQKKMEELGQKLLAYIIILALTYLVLGVFFFKRDFNEMFLVSIIIVVMAVPEGLPTIITITLAIGMQGMAKRNAIIRKLPAVETLGSTTVICTDKTGTLTKNKIGVRRIFLPGGEYEVAGQPDSFIGEFVLSGPRQIGTLHSRLEKLIEISSLCNNASIVESDGKQTIVGDPTESALLVMAKKFGYNIESERAKSHFIWEIPFDSERKIMSVCRRHEDKKTIYVKGALEVVLKRCNRILSESGVRPLTKDDVDKIYSKNSEFSKNDLRVLAVAYKEVHSVPKRPTTRFMESSLIFVGLIGMTDPPRPEVYEAIRKCKNAGIKVIMITGDGKETAYAVAKEIEIATNENEVLEGDQIDAIPADNLVQELAKIKVIARASPHHKYQIVSSLMAAGEIVAVTGDGVNDAPAIKKANIGIAMGITGTDVAKEVSDMVLTDDNFATIVNAIEYGRRLYDNIKSFVRYQFSTNVAAILTLFSAQFWGLGIPLTVLQMLWINIIMDGPPAVALGFEPSSSDTMQRKPRDPKTPFITRNLILAILFAGVIMATGTLAVFSYYKSNEPIKAGTAAFTTFVFFQFANALNCKSQSRSLLHSLFSNKYLYIAIILAAMLHISIIYNPIFQHYFQTVSLEPNDWVIIITTSMTIIVLEEIKKFFFKSQTEY
ncbi:MAG: HAD-IC family P-type ATPase [Candidatus Anstonellales archaeon]